VIGTDAVAKAGPDGYTLLLMSNTHTVNETLLPNKPFQLMRDFVPVAPINYSDLLLVVHPSVPANNLRELIALAKSQPGKMNYASSGPGTPYHMAGELFKSMAGIDVVHVPYKGSDGARVGILGGQVQMMFDAITTMAPNVRAGKLKELGVSLAIDDFGTGYSSLASLRRYPVDRLKIDRSFTADLPADENAKALTAGIIGLAHALGLKVIAEGVETEAQRDFLAALGCDFAQGYLTGKPVDADSAAAGYL